MESSDQSQQQPDETMDPNLTPPADQTVAAPSGVYPPPYYPSPSSPAYPFDATVIDATTPSPAMVPAQGRMSRIQALDLLSRLKTTLAVGSVIAFGMFAALAASHVTGVTSRSSASTQSSGGSQGSQAAPVATAPSSDDNGGFFGQSPSSGFGIGPPSSQAPAAGTSVS